MRALTAPMSLLLCALPCAAAGHVRSAALTFTVAAADVSATLQIVTATP